MTDSALTGSADAPPATPLSTGSFILAKAPTSAGPHLRVHQLLFVLNDNPITLIKLDNTTGNGWSVDAGMRLGIVHPFPWTVRLIAQNEDSTAIGSANVEPIRLYSSIVAARSFGKQEVRLDVDLEDSSPFKAVTLKMEVDYVVENGAEYIQDEDTIGGQYFAGSMAVWNETGGLKAPGKVDEINRWICTLRSTIPLVSKHNPFTLHLFNSAALALDYHWRQTGDVASLDESVASRDRLAKSTFCTAEARVGVYSEMITNLELHFRQSNSAAHASRALEVAQQLISLSKQLSNASGLIKGYRTSARRLFHRYELERAIEDLDGAIEAQEGLVLLVQSDLSALLQALDFLVRLHDQYYAREKELPSLEKAIERQTQAVELTSPGDAQTLNRVIDLQRLYTALWRHTKSISALGQAVSTSRRELKIMADLGKTRAEIKRWRLEFVSLIYERFLQTKDMADIDEAINIIEEEIAASKDAASPEALEYLALADAYDVRFLESKDLHDLKTALAHGRTVLRMMTSDTPTDKRARANANLAQYLMHFFETKEDEAVINEAISYAQVAADLTPPGGDRHDIYAHNYAMALSKRFELSGSAEDIDTAVVIQRALLLAVSLDHPERPRYVISLAGWLLHQFAQSQDLGILNEAISLQQNLLSTFPVGDERRLRYLDNLIASFQRRFAVTGETSDFVQALTLLNMLVAETSENDPGYPIRCRNLAALLYDQYARSKDPDDLVGAISALQNCLSHMTEDHHDYYYVYSTMGSLLHTQLDRVGYTKLDAIDHAIGFHHTALAQMAKVDVDRRMVLKNTSAAYVRRFKVSLDRSDLFRAVELLGESKALTPPTDSAYPEICSALASTHHDIWKLEGTEEQLELTIENFRLTALAPLGAPLTRVGGGRLSSFRKTTNIAETVEAFDLAIALLSQVASHQLTVEIRHHRLSSASTLSLEASSTALKLQQPTKALEWLEQGRCLVWSQINSLRKPIDDLRERDPQLADRVISVSGALERAAARTAERDPVLMVDSHTMNLQEKISAQAEVTRHLQLAKEWEGLVATIRGMPGLERFGMPDDCGSIMQNLPEGGYIVAVVVSDERCDALVLSAGMTEPLHIPLLEFDGAKAEQLRTKLDRRLASSGLRARGAAASSGLDGVKVDETLEEDCDEEDITAAGLDGAEGDELLDRLRLLRLKARRAKPKASPPVIEEVLRELWEGLVKPIYDALELKPVADDSEGTPQTRIWWCTTGALAFLPVHAAGVYSGENQICSADYAISSYTPTVSALSDRPSSFGLSTIPGTTEEVETVSNLVKSRSKHGVRTLIVHDTDASMELVLAKMGEYSCVHLACHGVQDTTDALESGFFLHDGSRIKLSDIVQAKTPNSDLAFLSACQTSSGAELYAEEAVHLAAGMLAAGYRGVVATMWAIGDEWAPQLASDFYEVLLEGGGMGIEGTRGARALHEATRRLRRSLDGSERSFMTWVPYVHFGL